MTRLPRRFELRLAFTAVMALLIAQLGALSHAYSHDAHPQGHDAYRHGVADAASIHSGRAQSHDPCGDCLAYAPLLSAAGTTSLLPFSLPQAGNSAGRAPVRSLIDAAPLLAFRSRAPPFTP